MAKPKRPASNPFDPFEGAVDALLDLHGQTGAQARASVESFLKTSRSRYPGGLVHLVTGKGRNSAAGPVLLGTVRALLKKGSPLVRGWYPDSGGGGFLVRLK